jgi:hypothetical protein
MQQRDYIERMIAQIAAAIAAILGAAAAGRFEEAERGLDEAWAALGVRRGDARRLDDGTVRAMLGGKAELGARLLEAEAEVEEGRGAGGKAAGLRESAAGLRGA